MSPPRIDTLPDHCPITEVELAALRELSKRGANTVDLEKGTLKGSLKTLGLVIATAVSVGAAYWALVGNVNAHEAQLKELRGTPEQIRALSKVDEALAIQLDYVPRTQREVVQLLTRIDERTTENARGIAELKARK